MDFTKIHKKRLPSPWLEWRVGWLIIEDAQTFVGWRRNNDDDCDGYFEASCSPCKTWAYSPGRCSFAVLGTKSSLTLLSRAISEDSKTYRIWNYKAEQLFPCLFAGWVSGTLVAVWFLPFPWERSGATCVLFMSLRYGRSWTLRCLQTENKSH